VSVIGTEEGLGRLNGEFIILLGGCTAVTLLVKVDEENEERGVEDDVEGPTPDAGAAGTGEVVVEHDGEDEEAGVELQDLNVGDDLLPAGANAECAG